MDRSDQRVTAEDRLRKAATVLDRLLKRSEEGDEFFAHRRAVLVRIVAEMATWKAGQAGTKRILALSRFVEVELSQLEAEYRVDVAARAERRRKEAETEAFRRLQDARRAEAARARPVPQVDAGISLGILYDMRNE